MLRYVATFEVYDLLLTVMPLPASMVAPPRVTVAVMAGLPFPK